MSVRAAFTRVAQSPSLRFVTGSAIYGAYIDSPAAIYANAAAALVIGVMNLHSARLGAYQFVVNGAVCLASSLIALSDAAEKIAEQGLTLENWGKLSIGLAYLSWAAADGMVTRLNLKGIERSDKKYLNPDNPNAIADVLASSNFPPIIATSVAAIAKEAVSPTPHEDTDVQTQGEFWNKHLSGTRLLAFGMALTGAAGAAFGYGAEYVAAFSLWAYGYTGFEPKRNAAIIRDWKNFKKPQIT